MQKDCTTFCSLDQVFPLFPECYICPRKCLFSRDKRHFTNYIGKNFLFFIPRDVPWIEKRVKMKLRTEMIISLAIFLSYEKIRVAFRKKDSFEILGSLVNIEKTALQIDSQPIGWYS